MSFVLQTRRCQSETRRLLETRRGKQTKGHESTRNKGSQVASIRRSDYDNEMN